MLCNNYLSTKILLSRNAPTGNHQRSAPVTEPCFAQSPYVHKVWATPVDQAGVLTITLLKPSTVYHPLYGYRLKTHGGLCTSIAYNAN